MFVEMQRPWRVIRLYILIVPAWVFLTDGVFEIWGHQLDSTTIVFSAVRSGILYLITAWILYKLINRIISADRRFHNLLEFSPQPFFVLDHETWLYANPAGVRLLGAASLEDLALHSFWDLISPNDQNQVRDRIQNSTKVSAVDHHIGIVMQQINGQTISVELLAAPIEFGGKQAIQLVLTDVTSKKRLEQDLVQSEKLAAVGQLAAGVAHEIRNPLTSVLGFMQILQTSAAEKQVEYIKLMTGELKRINSIAQEMLTLAKPHSEPFSVIDLPDLMRQVFHFLQPEANIRNIDFRLQIHDIFGPMYIAGHENRIKQVLINLVRNAMDALKEADRSVTLESRQEDEQVTICVRDTGIGIPPEQLPDLGQPFYTTKEHGTGLGLHVCRQIIREHRGQMWFTSKVGYGTTVHLSLPSSSQPEPLYKQAREQ